MSLIQSELDLNNTKTLHRDKSKRKLIKKGKFSKSNVCNNEKNVQKLK